MPSRLPNAPLIEVVFELRWKLENFPTLPLSIDPGYPTLLDLFEGYAKRKGFGRQTEHQPGYGGIGESVSRRFYKGEAAFPILQLGHGLFAANASVEYEWNSFRKLAINGASFVVENYPKLRNFNLNITRLEIRYIDGFEEPFVGAADWVDFINLGTTGRIDLPTFWGSDRLKKKRRGRFFIESDTRKPRGSIFNVEFASARKGEIPTVRMTSKIIKNGDKIISTNKIGQFTKSLEEWLDDAHEIASNSFKNIITRDMYEKFK